MIALNHAVSLANPSRHRSQGRSSCRRKRGHNRVSFAAWDLRRGSRAIYFWPTIRYLVSEIAARGMHRGTVHANDLRAADVQGGILRMN